MSLGSSLSGINFSGISSGIDTESIISRLLQIEAIPIQRLQVRQQQLGARQNLLNQFKGRLTALSTAASSLNASGTFNPISATSSKTDVATITGTSSAVAGTYELKVSKLAQAHKVSSAAQNSASEALNLSGSFTINGKGVTVANTDSLTTIAQKINATSSGVTASIIDGGTGNAYLTLTANASGVAGKVQIGDAIGSIAETLGLTSGALAIREPITGGATSIAFTSPSTSLATALNLTSPGSKTFNLNGTNVTVDFDTATLQDVANAINTSGSGAVATVRTVSKDGVTTYRLDITGITTFDDPDHALEAMGVLQRGYGNPMITAQDAEYELDGISLTSASNTIANVIPGATINLLKANETTPETSTLTLAKDTAQIKQKVQEFVDAYNAVTQFVKTNTQFDKDTFAAGGLFGDATVQGIDAQLASALFSSPTGLSGTITNLTQLGFTFSSEGQLTVNEATLDSALANNLTGVSSLFRAVGSSANAQIQFVSSTSKTRASGPAGYSVVISQLATQHALRAEGAQTDPLLEQEFLTFGGSAFGNNSYELVLDAGMTQAQIVERINNDAKLKDLVSATLDGGKLQLTAKKYGTPGTFTVVSNRTAAGNTSGWGTNEVVVAGVDVAGTINGETTTGSGQMLTGSTGNANTEGLQFLYTGNTLGAVGNLLFTKGMSPIFTDLIGGMTDSVNGVLTATDQSLTDQIKTIDESISDLQERLADKQVSLRAKFARMEQAVSQLQSQQSRLSAIRSQG
jgi:flagellar hook-associated protein 2